MNAPAKTPPRRATNISLDEDMVAQAKALGINLSRACEAGLRREVELARKAKWQADNRAAMDQYNAYIEEHGIPFGDLHQV